MDLSVVVSTEDNDSADLDSLVTWLRESAIDATTFNREARTPGPGEMGVQETLSVVFATPVAVAGTKMLVQSIHEWIKTRVKNTSVTIRRKDGVEIELSTSSTDSDDGQALLDKVESLVQ